jgi:hypothetical protein
VGQPLLAAAAFRRLSTKGLAGIESQPGPFFTG